MYKNLIQVVNKHTHTPNNNDVYCGRGSPLGNPYTHLDSKFHDVVKLDSRDKACDAFEVFLDAQLEDPKSPQRKAMAKLYNHVKKGNPLNLVCFCKPSRCHLDYVRTILIEALEKSEK